MIPDLFLQNDGRNTVLYHKILAAVFICLNLLPQILLKLPVKLYQAIVVYLLISPLLIYISYTSKYAAFLVWCGLFINSLANYGKSRRGGF